MWFNRFAFKKYEDNGLSERYILLCRKLLFSSVISNRPFNLDKWPFFGGGRERFTRCQHIRGWTCNLVQLLNNKVKRGQKIQIGRFKNFFFPMDNFFFLFMFQSATSCWGSCSTKYVKYIYVSSTGVIIPRKRNFSRKMVH